MHVMDEIINLYMINIFLSYNKIIKIVNWEKKLNLKCLY